MMEKNKNDEIKKIDTKKVNSLLITGNKILKIMYALFIILLIYVASLIFKDWKILGFIGTILKIISPLFIGWFIAWLLNPMVKRFVDKGMKKTLAVILAFVIFLSIIGLILGLTLPSLGTQITEIVSAIPEIANDVQIWIDDIFVKISNMSLSNLDTIKTSFLEKIDNFSLGIQTSIPEKSMALISSLASGIGNIALSLILGFYILYDFDKVSEIFIEMFPRKSRKDVKYLMAQLNDSLYSYISGTLWLSLLLFIVSVVGFSIVGLNAPVLIAFICVITNLIPYIGPYIGAGIAAAIGFVESPLIGTLTLIFILIVQMLEGNVLHPLVMSKKLNLSPITIIISLMLFEYMFGIFGMVIATPCVALIKIIYVFFDEKYNFFSSKSKEEE